MRIDHAALYVRDLEGARAFFERYLGGVTGARYHNPTTDFQSYFLSFEGGARTTGDGYYESCVAGFEGNQIELTV